MNDRFHCTIACTVLLATACSAIAPKHDIPAKPDYVRAGIEVGDRVEVTTNSGETASLVITSVENDRLVGEQKTFRLSELAKITKRSWDTPRHPCEGEQPPGCSIPGVLTILSDVADDYSEQFHRSCVTHDFCYANGFATYGATREQCDENFLSNMQKECKGPGGLGVLDVEAFATCQVVAQQIYDIVRTYGEKHYKMSTSTYCEYR